MTVVIPVRMHFNTEDLWFDPGNTGAVEGDHVVVSTERGTEFGLATSDPFEAPASEVHGKLKPVLRVASDDDVQHAEELAEKGEQTMPLFRELVNKYQLDMKPAGVEFLFGGEKVVFYFAAEERVDFRELVRDLSSHFHSRIDMRQIGVRDEARLQGGYATCGQELCCRRLGGKFEPVSIRMAKEQDLPLNSAKISGVCGRLMCCLRYEFEAYKDFKQRAPKRNAVIDTPLGKAKIVEYNTPRETMTMRLENGKSFTVALSDMTCSEACQKRSKEQKCPLRPDTVSRTAIERFAGAEILAQLAEMDRQSDPQTYAFELDSSLISPRRTRTSHTTSSEPTQAPGESAARRRSHRAQTSTEVSPATPQPQTTRTRRHTVSAAAPEVTSDERPTQRKGMHPRRQTSSSAGTQAPSSQERTQERVHRTHTQARAQSAPTSSSAAPAAPSPSENRQHRATRRHHTTQQTPATETPSTRTAATREAQKEPTSTPQQQSQQTRTRTRRHHTVVEGEQPSKPRSTTPQEHQERPQNQGSGVRRRHRHPGDHGGDATDHQTNDQPK